MLKICVVALSIVAAVFAVCSYAICGTLLDEKWGSSFMSARDSQILNPEARHNLGCITGLDAVAAGAVMEKYRASFKTQSGAGSTGGQTLGTITLSGRP